MKRLLTFLRVLSARLRFVAVFAIAALVVGYWDHIKARLDRWTRPPHEYAATEVGAEYYCPMHPQVVRSQPGQCPICNMDLKKRDPREMASAVQGRVQLSPQRMSLAGIATTPVLYKPLMREVRALGLLDYDETRLANLSARVAGRADELFLTFTGQPVKAGDAVYSLYSPEVFTAQREYLQARKRVNDLPTSATADARADASAVYNATMQKLVLWGISRDQLDTLDKDFDASGKVPTHFSVTSPITGIVVRKDVTPGQYLQVGQSAYTVADLSKLWLRAKIYEADIPLVKVGQGVTVRVDALPNETFDAVITYLAFALDPETRTIDARIEVPNNDMRLRPGMFASATIRVPAVPSTQPATASTAPAIPSKPAVFAGDRGQPRSSAVFQAALKPYLQSSDLLAHDKSEGVADLLEKTVAMLKPLASEPSLQEPHARLISAVKETPGEEIKALRETFKKISLALIDMSKVIGQPMDAVPLQIFRCPMRDKPYWLQPAGPTAINPYMGLAMLDCGGPVENVPKAAEATPVESSAASTKPAFMLAIPRSAVIDTGMRKVVYVETSPGVFDLRAVQLGNMSADDLYPVISGLKENDRVVTKGAFLVDSENRLNPSATQNATPSPAPKSGEGSAGQAPAQVN